MVGWGGGGDWGWGGTGLPSVFSFMSGLFVNYWGRSFSVGWLALWLSLFAELPGGGGAGGGSLLCLRLCSIYLSIILISTCPWAGSLALAR